MLRSNWTSTAQALTSWRGVTSLVLTAVGVAKQIVWIEATWVAPSWAWWLGAILVLFASNVRLTHQQLEQLPPRPDIGAAEAFKMIIAQSRRAQELVAKRMLVTELPYESHLTEVGKTEQRLQIWLRGELLNLLRQGHVKAWGEPRDSRADKEIEKEEWARMELDLDERHLNSTPSNICAMGRTKPEELRSDRLEYTHVRFCRANIFREFPLMAWPRRVDHVPLTKA